MRLPPKLWRLLRSRRLRRFAIWTPIVLMFGFAAFYSGVNAWGREHQRRLLNSLPARGYETKAEVYFGDDLDESKDAFSGPAMAALLDEKLSGRSSWRSFKLPRSKRPLGLAADLTKMVSPRAKDDHDLGDRLRAMNPGLEAVWPDVCANLRREDAAYRGWSMEQRNASVVRTSNLRNYAAVHAMTGMLKDQPGEALKDFQALADLERHAFRSRPTILSVVIGERTQQNFSDLVWEGVKRGVWDEESLRQLAAMLDGLNPARDAVLAVRGEVAMNCSIIKVHENYWGPEIPFNWRDLAMTAPRDLPRVLHDAWYCARPVGLTLMAVTDFQEQMIRFGSEDAGRPRDHFSVADLVFFRSQCDQKGNPLFENQDGSKWFPSSWLMLRNLTSFALDAQAQLELTRTGIALERYRIRTGRYPEKLEALAPEFLPGVPSDPFTERQPLHYRLQPDSSPHVWSVGRNLVDDGGIPRLDTDLGDLVWLTQPIPGYKEWKYENSFW